MNSKTGIRARQHSSSEGNVLRREVLPQAKWGPVRRRLGSTRASIYSSGSEIKKAKSKRIPFIEYYMNIVYQTVRFS